MAATLVNVASRKFENELVLSSRFLQTRFAQQADESGPTQPAPCGVMAIDRNPNKARRRALAVIRYLLGGC